MLKILSKNKTEGKTTVNVGEKRAQDWYPISDIRDSTVYMKDGRILSVLRVYPINISLLSKTEKKSKIAAVSEWLNSEKENIQIFCVGRPMDLAHFQDWQQEILDTTEDYVKKQILKNYIIHTAALATSGNVTERRFYIILSKEAKKGAEKELLVKLEEIRQKLVNAQLRSEICSERELKSLYLLFSFPGNIDETSDYASQIGTLLEA